MGGDEAGQVRRRGEGGVDLGRVAGGAVVGPGEVELEAVGAAAALEGQVGQVVDLVAGGRRRVRVEEVVGH